MFFFGLLMWMLCNIQAFFSVSDVVYGLQRVDT